MVQEFSLLAGDAHRDKKLNQLLALKHAGIAELVNTSLSIVGGCLKLRCVKFGLRTMHRYPAQLFNGAMASQC